MKFKFDIFPLPSFSHRKISQWGFTKKIKGFGSLLLAVSVMTIVMGFSINSSKISFQKNYSDNELAFESKAMIASEGDTLDLALVLTTPNTFACPGSTISFTIEIINQGDSAVESLELTNYIPAGLTLSAGNVGWIQNGNLAQKTITGTVNGGGFTTEQILFDVDSLWTGDTIENRVEISAADCDFDPNNAPPIDIDSEFDDIDNDTIGGDNELNGANGDEDDHDFAYVFNNTPTLTDTTITSSLCNFDNGTISLTPTNFISYDWSDGGTGSSRNDLFAGMYSVTITNVAGCSAVVSDLEVLNDCTGCEAMAGTVTMSADTFCLEGDSLLVTFTDDGNSVEPQPQFITAYVLTKDSNDVIMDVDTVPNFYVYEKGSYEIHVKVFDVLHIPQEELDSFQAGVSELPFFEQFYQNAGGYLCGDIDMVGVPFEVGTSKSTVAFLTDEDCGQANGSVTMTPPDFTYTWSDGGTGATRNDLTVGTYAVTVDGCAGCQDSVQNIIIGSNCILNDTIHFTIELDSVETICGNPIPSYFSNNTTTTLCAGGTSGTDGTYGSYTVQETGCLEYTANSSIPGNDIDTICVVVIDDMGNADTTVFIPTVICHTVPSLINVTCNTSTNTGSLCLPIPFDSINTYNVTLDGVPFQTGFTGCDEDSLVQYDYNSVFAQGGFGPYDVDSWTVDGQTMMLSFQTMQDLVDSMNVFDPAGNWVVDATAFTLTGGNPTSVYSDMTITHPLTSSTAMLTPVQLNFFNGSAMTLPEGTSQVVYTKMGDPCPSQALEATVFCDPCVPFLPTDTVEIISLSCAIPGDFCVNIDAADIFNYTVMVDGAAYSGGFSVCDFSGTDDGTNLQLAAGLHEVILTNNLTSCADTVLVNVSCTPCLDWLPDTLVQLTTTECHLTQPICINVDTSEIGNYEIRDNGILYAGSILSCMDSSLVAISVGTGFHEISMTNSITGCTDTMGVQIDCIPDTIFLNELIEVADVDSFCFDQALVGELSNMQLFCGDTTGLIVDYTVDTISNCILFEGLTIGTDSLCFSLTDSDGNQTDVYTTITVTDLICPDWVPDSEMVMTSECHTDYVFCTNVDTSEIATVQIMDNGMMYGGTTSSCTDPAFVAISLDTGFHEIILTDTISGCADTIALTINCVPDTIVLDTVIEITDMDTLCLDEMMVGDIADIDIICGDTMDVTINYTLDTITNCIIFEGIEIGEDTLCFELIDINGNRTQVFLNITVTPPPCVDWIPDVLDVETTQCHLDQTICINVDTSEIANFEIMDNGVLYGGSILSCSDSSLVAIALDTGFHEIILTDTISGCADTMALTINCVPEVILIDTLMVVNTSDTLCLDEMINGDIADIDILCGDTTDLVVNYTIDTMTNCIIFEGIDFGVDSLCFELTNADGNRTEVYLYITVTPVCPGSFITISEIDLAATDCPNPVELCLDIPFGQITDYTVFDNGMGYTGGFSGCDFDTINSYNYFAIPGQGNDGPYTIDSWTINDSTYTGAFDSIHVLVDSMNVWDTTGTWILDTMSLTISGGNVNSTYSDITITQDATSAFALIELGENLIPTNTALQLEEGMHELIFSVDSTLCRDTVTAMVWCLTPEIVVDTIFEGDIETYCLDLSELVGDVVSIVDECPENSGDFVSFTIVDSTACVTYEGLDPGDNQACIVVCDDIGLCDTTSFFITVLIDTLSPPLAVDDIDTTMINDPITINILGNDFIPGIFDNYILINAPDSGMVSFNGDGTITYTPNEDYCDNNTPDTLTYEVCNSFGCDTATVFIWVNCEDGPLEFYSGMSPNGDGINDYFIIQGVDQYPNNVLCIFNRWGNRVFYQEGYTNSEATAFDGNWENTILPDGTYFYVFDDGEGTKHSGYVQIAR